MQPGCSRALEPGFGAGAGRFLGQPPPLEIQVGNPVLRSVAEQAGDLSLKIFAPSASVAARCLEGLYGGKESGMVDILLSPPLASSCPLPPRASPRLSGSGAA